MSKLELFFKNDIDANTTTQISKLVSELSQEVNNIHEGLGLAEAYCLAIKKRLADKRTPTHAVAELKNRLNEALEYMDSLGVASADIDEQLFDIKENLSLTSLSTLNNNHRD